MKYLQLIAHLRCSGGITFPDNPVNTFRGAFGFQLKHAVCFQRAREIPTCRGCLAERTCVYALSFETPAGDDCHAQTGGGHAAPHPILLGAGFSGPATFPAGSEVPFTLTLFGKAVDALPYFILALRELAANGLSSARVPCELVWVTTPAGRIVYDAGLDRLEPVSAELLTVDQPGMFGGLPLRVTIQFETPTCFKDKANGRISNVPEFHRLVRSLLRRFSTMATLDGGNAPAWDYGYLVRQAEAVKTVEDGTRIVRWERFSQRQQQRSFFGGMVGPVVFQGDLHPFLPLLRAGEIIQVGRSTIFGQGRYRITKVAAAETARQQEVQETNA